MDNIDNMTLAEMNLMLKQEQEKLDTLEKLMEVLTIFENEGNI